MKDAAKPKDIPARMGGSTCGEPFAAASKRPADPVRGCFTVGDAVRAAPGDKHVQN